MTAAVASAPDRLDLDTLRDDLVRNHNPAGPNELMLVTQIAQSWLRLQRAYETERRFFEGRDMGDLLATKLDQFKAITRYVTDSERAWRHATLNLEKVQRRRLREGGFSPNARRGPVPARISPPPLPNVPPPSSAPLVSQAAVPKRE